MKSKGYRYDTFMTPEDRKKYFRNKRKINKGRIEGENYAKTKSEEA